MVDHQRHERAKEQAESRGGESAQRKTLYHFIDRNQQPTESKTDGHPDQPGVLDVLVVGMDIADGVAAKRA